MKKKIHILDLIFLIGIIVFGLLGSVIDSFYWKDVENGGFPVFSMMSIFASYTLWGVLLICSAIKYKEPQNKPKYVRWYMYFLLPFLHVAVMIVGWILADVII